MLAHKSVPICHTRCMHLTETFASTAAVTIPVLMLAGAVELRSLADTVGKRTVKAAKKWLTHTFEFYLIELDNEHSGRLKTFRTLIFYLKLTSGDFFISLLPVIWSMTLLSSAVVEVFCLLYLAGVHFESSTALLIVIAISILMTLLIITPIIQAVFIAPSVAYHEFDAEAMNALCPEFRHEIPVAALPAIDVENKRKQVERIKSIILSDTSDSVAQKQR